MKTHRGFTLIELMIVVAIIAILAAIAVPAYMDYVARAQVSEGYSLASDARQAIVIYHADKSTFPPDNGAAGLASPGSITGNYVESVTIGPSDGKVDVLFGKNSSGKIHGQTLTLTMVAESGAFHWRCSGLDPKFVPSACR